MKKIISLAFLFYISLGAFAQNMESNAIQFSSTNNNGSPRYVGLSGAMSAVGGDFSVANYNPAGIGIYRSSVLGAGLSYEWTKTKTKFDQSQLSTDKGAVNVPYFGLVFHSKNRRKGIFKHFNIAFSSSTGQSYIEQSKFERTTTDSYTKQWQADAINTYGDTLGNFNYDVFSFETVGAYYAYLVNYDTALNAYTTPITQAILQSQNKNTRGFKRDFTLSFGGNWWNKLYVGASLSVPFSTYRATTIFNEKDNKNLNGDFEDFTLTQQYKNTGSGIKANVGVIVKPVKYLSIALAGESPTRLALEEEYNSDFETNYTTATFEQKSSLGKFKYTLITPWSANAGVALIHPKWGFVSVDYQLKDFSKTKFVFEEKYASNASKLNEQIQKKYTIQHQVKVGVEAKLKKWKLRAGYHLSTSPLKTAYREKSYDFSMHQFSGGVGVLFKRVALDLAYQYSLFNTYALSYNLNDGLRKNNHRQLISLGLSWKISR